MKNVVVVGAGVIGSNAASQLASKLPPTHRVVLISETDFGYWPIGSLRAAVAPGASRPARGHVVRLLTV